MLRFSRAGKKFRKQQKGHKRILSIGICFPANSDNGATVEGAGFGVTVAYGVKLKARGRRKERSFMVTVCAL